MIFLVLKLLKILKIKQSLKITSAGLNESHVHSISITRESPNYRKQQMTESIIIIDFWITGYKANRKKSRSLGF